MSKVFSYGNVNIEEDKPIISNFIAEVTPNPVSETGTLKIDANEIAIANISIYSMSGSRIMDIANNEAIEIGPNYFNFDVSNLGQGVYVVQIEIGGTVLMKEFVVVR
jgi:hypothetical protein